MSRTYRRYNWGRQHRRLKGKRAIRQAQGNYRKGAVPPAGRDDINYGDEVYKPFEIAWRKYQEESYTREQVISFLRRTFNYSYQEARHCALTIEKRQARIDRRQLLNEKKRKRRNST